MSNADEFRDEFLTRIHGIIAYWHRQVPLCPDERYPFSGGLIDHDEVLKRLEGLAMSILCMLDGQDLNISPMVVYKKKGKSPKNNISGNLHERFHPLKAELCKKHEVVLEENIYNVTLKKESHT